MPIRWTIPLTLLIAGVLLPTGSAAQAVSGHVRSATGEDRIAGATVTAITPAGRVAGTAITTPTGDFLLRLPATGEYLISASRLGFLDIEPIAVSIAGRETVTVEIELVEQAIEIAGVTATGRRADRLDEASIEGVLARRLAYPRGATRRVVMHTDAEFRNATRVTHVLGFLPASNRCVIVLKDGAPLSGSSAGIGLQSHPDDYLAIEWYRSWSDAPGTLRGVPGHVLQPWKCSVVALWTRE